MNQLCVSILCISSAYPTLCNKSVYQFRVSKLIPSELGAYSTYENITSDGRLMGSLYIYIYIYDSACGFMVSGLSFMV